jgi:hypothetical protein
MVATAVYPMSLDKFVSRRVCPEMVCRFHLGEVKGARANCKDKEVVVWQKQKVTQWAYTVVDP